MFGSKKIQELEARLSELQGKLDAESSEKSSLAQQLESANGKIAELEAQLNDFDLERLKEEAKTSRAEYEGLRELYARKNREFDENVEAEEENFAREQAIKRHNLENEIRDNRQANEDYVSNTVKTFSESYNYYLNQIKVLMDALGDVATRTGEALFSGENDDLKARFGNQMREVLKSGTDTLSRDEGDLILIGYADEATAPAAEAEEEVAEDPVEDVADEAVEEVVDEAAEDDIDDIIAAAIEEGEKEAEEAAEESVEEAVGEEASEFIKQVEEVEGDVL